jgi:hypothetical protein
MRVINIRLTDAAFRSSQYIWMLLQEWDTLVSLHGVQASIVSSILYQFCSNSFAKWIRLSTVKTFILLLVNV